MAKKEDAPLIEIADQLDQQDITKLTNALELPSGLFERVTEGRRFLSELKKWGKHDPYQFDQCLHAIGRADLSERAREFRWLAASHPVEGRELIGTELSMKSLVRTLKTELRENDWDGITLLVPAVEFNMSFEAKMHILMRQGYISRNLSRLIALMTQIKRTDIGETIQKYIPLFTEISDLIFVMRFEKEVVALGKEIATWEVFLRRFIKTKHQKVKQMIDDDRTS